MAEGFNVHFDDSDLNRGLDKLNKSVDDWFKLARLEMADTLLLLSSFEVPHDKGTLQASGHVFFDEAEDAACTAYNTDYAAFLHEGIRRDGTHLIKHFQKGRKKKYLEDPLKMNLSTWEQIGNDSVAKKLSGSI